MGSPERGITGTDVVKSTCRICYNNCGVLIRLQDGRPVEVQGDPENPLSKGLLCPKGQASLEYLHHPDRLQHPLRRSGARGQGRFQRISWEQAIAETAAGLDGARKRHGPLSVTFIRGASKGLLDDYLARFANLFGSPNISSPAPVCFVPGLNASRLTYGGYLFPDYDYPGGSVTVWGCNPEATNIADNDAILKRVKAGARLLVVDPLESNLSRLATLWLRPRPGTDAALALGLMHVIIAEGLHDRAFVESWTTGFPELQAHVRPFHPDRVAELTWVPAEKIAAAARLYATAKPGCLNWGNGIETTINSFSACRAIAMLRALAGNIGIPGGDVACANPGGIVKGDRDFVCQDNIPAELRARRLSRADGLLPIVYYALPQRIIRAILTEDPYPVKALYVQGANLLASYTNAAQTRQALDKLDFLVVADMFLTPTASLADIVLPAASYLEFDSVEQPWNMPIASVQQKVAQLGECRSDGHILNELARRLGFTAQVWNDMQEPLEQVLKPAGICFEEFRKIGYLVGPKLYRSHLREGFATPSRKVELYSAQLRDWGFDPLPVYREPPETPFSEPQAAEDYPLLLTSRKSSYYRHSGGRQIASLRARHPEPVVKLHPDAASSLGIREGDWVSVVTRRGRIRQKAGLEAALDPRVIEVDYAWWFPESQDWQSSNLNLLTSDQAPFNPELGSAHMRGIFCRLEKIDE